MSGVAQNEVGRELKAAELKVGTVVIVHPPGKNALLTLWVRSISPDWVEFYSGTYKWHIVNFVMPDDTIVDDSAQQVHVYEYLGEV